MRECGLSRFGRPAGCVRVDLRQFRNRRGLVAAESVRVAVHRERDRRVAHNPLDDLGVHAGGREPRATRVAETV